MSAAEMYKEFAQSHEGTAVSAAPDRDVSSEQLNQAAKSHGGEAFDAEANAQAAAEASALDDASGDAPQPPEGVDSPGAHATAPSSSSPGGEQEPHGLAESPEFLEGLRHVSNVGVRGKAMYMARKMQVCACRHHRRLDRCSCRCCGTCTVLSLTKARQ